MLFKILYKIFFVEANEIDHNSYCTTSAEFGYMRDKSSGIIRGTNKSLSNVIIETMNSILDSMEMSKGKRKTDFNELEYQAPFKKMKLNL